MFDVRIFHSKKSSKMLTKLPINDSNCKVLFQFLKESNLKLCKQQLASRSICFYRALYPCAVKGAQPASPAPLFLKAKTKKEKGKKERKEHITKEREWNKKKKEEKEYKLCTKEWWHNFMCKASCIKGHHMLHKNGEEEQMVRRNCSKKKRLIWRDRRKQACKASKNRKKVKKRWQETKKNLFTQRWRKTALIYQTSKFSDWYYTRL